jgi:acetoin:2,6-dichlorophenolindophenol oxidoreductase subunit beta
MNGKPIKYWQALNAGLVQEMERDETVFLLGEDVAVPGGPFGVTQGLLDRFGPNRVRDTPISEAGLVGLATGAAMTGVRPVVEIMFFDFILLTLDQLINHAAKMRFMSGGVHRVPLTLLTACGARRGTGPQHSQIFDVAVGNTAGLHVVWPSTPADAKGLVASAIRSDDPVLVIESLSLLRATGEIPDGDYVTPLGTAAVVREGADVTLVGVGSVMPSLSQCAEELAADGIAAEVIDLRSIAPLDLDTLCRSVAKTGRLVVAHDSPPELGLGAAVVGRLMPLTFGDLRAAPQIVAPPMTPVPFNPALEALYYPDAAGIRRAVETTLA